jgi:type II secretory pathway predicted ATPase ExeA
MSLDYLSHFGLSADPFGKDISDAELWMPPSKQSLVEDLTDAMHARASALLTGEPGVGKTCVLRALRQALTPANFRLVYCQNATVGRRDFYRHLCIALGLAKVSTAGDLFMAVSAHVEDLAKERVCPVFLVDEAHLLHQDTLDHLHILLNYQWDQKPLLSLVLIGLPELDDRLRLRRNRSLYSRLHHRFAIGSLVPDDTNDYLRARLARVGATKDLFSADALSMLH